MRTLTSKRYSLLGFSDKEGFVGWVFKAYSPKPSGDSAMLVVKMCKFVNDGIVYHLMADGTCIVNGVCQDNRDLAYSYDYL